MNCGVIVSAIIEKDGKLLLGRKPKDVGPYPNTWHLPGGAMKLGEESITDELKREVNEETGIEITDIEHVSFDEDYESNKHGEMTHYIFLVFKAKHESGDLNASDDITELKWIDRSALKDIELPRPSVKLFKKLRYI